MGATTSRPLSHHVEDHIIRLASLLDSLTHFISRIFSPIIGPIFASSFGRALQDPGADIAFSHTHHRGAPRRDNGGLRGNGVERARQLKKKQEERKARAEAAAAGLPIPLPEARNGRGTTSAPANADDKQEGKGKRRKSSTTAVASAAEALAAGADRDNARAKAAAKKEEKDKAKVIVSDGERRRASVAVASTGDGSAAESSNAAVVLSANEEAEAAAQAELEKQRATKEKGLKVAVIALKGKGKHGADVSGTEVCPLVDELDEQIAVAKPAKYATALMESAPRAPSGKNRQRHPELTPRSHSSKSPLLVTTNPNSREVSSSSATSSALESDSSAMPTISPSSSKDDTSDTSDSSSTSSPELLTPIDPLPIAPLNEHEDGPHLFLQGARDPKEQPAFARDLFSANGAQEKSTQGEHIKETSLLRNASALIGRRRSSRRKPSSGDSPMNSELSGETKSPNRHSMMVGMETLGRAGAGGLQLGLEAEESAPPAKPLAEIRPPSIVASAREYAPEPLPHMQEPDVQASVTQEDEEDEEGDISVDDLHTLPLMTDAVREELTGDACQAPANPVPCAVSARTSGAILPTAQPSSSIEQAFGTQPSPVSDLPQPSRVVHPRSDQVPPSIQDQRDEGTGPTIAAAAEPAVSKPTMLVHRPTARRIPTDAGESHSRHPSAVASIETITDSGRTMPDFAVVAQSPKIVRVPTVRPAAQRPRAPTAAPAPESRPESPGIRTIRKGNTMSIATQLEEQVDESGEAASELRELMSLSPKTKASPRRSSVPAAEPSIGSSPKRRGSVPVATIDDEKDHDEDERDLLPPIQRPPSRSGTPGGAAYYRPPSRGPSPRTGPSVPNGNSSRSGTPAGRGVTPPPRSGTATPPVRPGSANTWRSILRAGSPASILPDTASIFSSSNRDREPVPLAEMADRACLRGWEASSKHRKVWKDEIERVARERCKGNKSRNEQRKEAAAAARAATPDAGSSAQKIIASYKRSEAEAALRDLDAKAVEA